MRVFVSYTRRDGVVTNPLLHSLHAFLSEVCEPFIHAVEEPKLKHQQLAVVKALFSCRLIILVVSPEAVHSPWVRFELLVGRLLLRPIIRINAKDRKSVV